MTKITKLDKQKLIKKYRGKIIKGPCTRTGRIVTGKVVGAVDRSVVIEDRDGNRECIPLTMLGFGKKARTKSESEDGKGRVNICLPTSAAAEQRIRLFAKTPKTK